VKNVIRIKLNKNYSVYSFPFLSDTMNVHLIIHIDGFKIVKIDI